VDLTLLLALVPVLLVLIGVRDLFRAGARDVLPLVAAMEAVLLASVTAFVLLPPSVATGAVLLAPLFAIPVVWSRLDRLVPGRIGKTLASLAGIEEPGSALLEVQDRLDALKATSGRWSTVALSGILAAVMGVGGLQLASGWLLVGSALCAWLPLSRLARLHVDQAEEERLRLALLESGDP
jgi:hypothetical protein